MSEIDVAIVGAGPYGLAAASHVARLGLSTAVLGEPMWFWRRRKPCGVHKLGLACKSNVFVMYDRIYAPTGTNRVAAT